jgi:hypothetical protein
LTTPTAKIRSQFCSGVNSVLHWNGRDLPSAWRAPWDRIAVGCPVAGSHEVGVQRNKAPTHSFPCVNRQEQAVQLLK